MRSPLQITLSVWKALFLREALFRLFGTRAAWLWLLLEPIIHIVFFMFIFGVIRMRIIGGMETSVWIMVGMLAFFLFRRTWVQAMNAVSANRALFAYRQVKPVDTVLVRSFVEGFLMLLVSAILFTAAGLSGLEVLPNDPLLVIVAAFGLWLLGLGLGLVTSVAQELVPELGKVVNLAMTPLYFISGVIFPLNAVPDPYRDWLLLNPVAHGLDAVRLGFATFYETVPGLNLGYLYACALVATFVGLILHVRYTHRLLTVT